MAKTQAPISPKDPTITLEITVPQTEIKAAYDSAIKSLAAKTELKGFRKGKAPIEVVEQNVDKNKVYEMVFNTVFPPVYKQRVEEAKIVPVTSPRVEVKDAKTDGDWQFVVKVAEKPVVKLGNYLDALKSAFAKDKIWVPGKDAKMDAKKEADKEAALSKIFDILLKNIPLEISSILIEEEANRTLSRLLDQIGKLGLTLDQYVSSLNKTVDDLKKEHYLNAEAALKLEYILEAISLDQKMAATDAEFETFLKTVTNPETKKQLMEKSDVQTAVKYNLTKRKVVDYLLSLAS